MCRVERLNDLRHEQNQTNINTARALARQAKRVKQLMLFEELEAVEKDAVWGNVSLPPTGENTLDRVQAMILFAAGRDRGETLGGKRASP